jgi:lysophospholipase L1-like esterase
MSTHPSLESITADLESGAPLTFATFGDSITWPCYHTDFRQNYITLTADALLKTYPKAHLRIVHAGNLGSLGRGLADNRFENLALKEEPDVVFIMFGMNDCAGGPNQLDHYDQNLTRAIGMTRDRGALPVVLTQNEVIYPDSGGRHALPLYMERAAAVAKREQVPFADCFAGWQPLKAENQTLAAYLNDAIHPNLAGHRLFARSILDALWPKAAEAVSDAPRTRLRPDDAKSANVLLPGPRGKQVVRTQNGTWFVVSGRTRGQDRLADLVVSFSRAEDPDWEEFQHVTLIGPQGSAVFDDQDRTLTAGMLLEADNRLWVIFSWNVGVFALSLDLTWDDWAQSAGEMATWMGHSNQPYPRPFNIYNMNHDGNVLHDAYLTADGWPAVFGRDFKMDPDAGWEVVKGEFGIGHVIRKPGEDPGTREFLFPRAHGLHCTRTPEGTVHVRVQQEADGPWQSGTLGSPDLSEVLNGQEDYSLPPVSANPRAFIDKQPTDPQAVQLSWSDGQQDGITWQTVPRNKMGSPTFAYQSRVSVGETTFALVTCDEGEFLFRQVETSAWGGPPRFSPPDSPPAACEYPHPVRSEPPSRRDRNSH